MLLVSHHMTAVSCAQRAFSAGTLRVGKAAQAIGAAVHVQFDGQLHPNFEGIESTGVALWSDLSPVRMTAPKVEQESVPRECVNCISLSFCQHCSCTPAQIVRTPPKAVASALAPVFGKRVIPGIESQLSFNCFRRVFCVGALRRTIGCEPNAANRMRKANTGAAAIREEVVPEVLGGAGPEFVFQVEPGYPQGPSNTQVSVLVLALLLTNAVAGEDSGRADEGKGGLMAVVLALGVVVRTCPPSSAFLSRLSLVPIPLSVSASVVMAFSCVSVCFRCVSLSVPLFFCRVRVRLPLLQPVLLILSCSIGMCSMLCLSSLCAGGVYHVQRETKMCVGFHHDHVNAHHYMTTFHDMLNIAVRRSRVCCVLIHTAT